MSVIDRLPKAPGAAEEEVKEAPSFHEEPATNKKDRKKQEKKHHTSNRSDIHTELMDTVTFNQALESAQQARTLAAHYTAYADATSLPPLDLIENDDVLFNAVQDALVKRAEDFYNTSNKALNTTINEKDSGDTAAFLDSEEISTVQQLFEIDQAHQK